MGNAAYYNGCFYSPNGAWVHTNAWPQVMVDRKATTPPDSLDDYFATYTDDAGLADIDITPVYNPGTRMLDVKAKVHFALDVPSSLAHLNLALVLTENDVHGTTINFSQRNKYSGGLSGPMASDEMDFAAQDDPVPADSMYYQHVARVISPSYKGKEGSLPTIIQADSIYSYTFPSYKIPAAYIPAKMRAIVLLIDTISGNIKNANGVNLSTVISGVHGASDPAGTFTLSPNPFNRETELRFSLKRSEQVSLKVLDVLGKVVSSRKLGNLQSGANSIQLSCAELTTGVYFVTITTEHETLTERVVVSR